MRVDERFFCSAACAPASVKAGAHVAQAGLVGGRGHAIVENSAGMVDHVIPVEGRARIDFVSLDMEMAQESVIILELVWRKLLTNQFAVLISRIVASDPGQNSAEGRCKPDQRPILLRGKVVLD